MNYESSSPIYSRSHVSDCRRLRVLFIPQWYPRMDASGHVTGTFCREHVRAASLFDDVAVLAFSGRQDRWPTLQWQSMNDDGIPTFYARYGMSPIPKTTRGFFYIHLRRAFRRVITEWGYPDVIHTQDEYAYYVMKWLAPYGVPFIISQHWTGFMERTIDHSGVRRFQWAFDRAAKVLPANKFAEEDYRSYGLHPQTTWLPNALDTNVFTPPANSNRQPWLLHASGFSVAKRFPDILQAFMLVHEKQPGVKLQIVGDGSNRVKMEALAKGMLSPDSYRFHGSLTKPELAELMRRSSGFVMASDAETFGCVLMEAMACGCPVLTTRIGGIPAVVREGDGLFFEVGNVPDIVAGMERLLMGTHDLNLERISLETRTRFSHSTIGQLLHDEHVLAARGMTTRPHNLHQVDDSHRTPQGQL